MQRRQFLIWFSRAVYTTCGLTVAAAGTRYLGAPLAGTEKRSGPKRHRLATLDSLPVGEPKLLAVEGTKQDAWVREPSQVIGNVWVTRLSDESTPPEKTQLTVFNAACPHNGCAIQKAAEAKGFACHCHGALFKPNGTRVADNDEFTNPSPRGMDTLTHEVVQDPQSGQWWVEVVYQEFETGLAERVVKA